jgi:hypothetical protein
MTRPDRWQKAAERANARAARDAGPLFAAFATRTTPDVVLVRTEARIVRMSERDRVWQERQDAAGAVARANVAAVLSPDELAALDAHRAEFAPPTAEYSANFWITQCRKRGLDWPGRAEHEELFRQVREGVAAAEAKTVDAQEQLALTNLG